jgi:hypothetical protein
MGTVHRSHHTNAKKEKSLERLDLPDTQVCRYQAPDSLMRFLQTL